MPDRTPTIPADVEAAMDAQAQAPFVRAPEASRSIFVIIFVAACAPLAAGVVFFGFRALLVAAVSVAGCVATESAYYHVTHTPALLGRMHAAVTGLLLALTLPPFTPWYVALTGAVFAIIVGKAIFGGVGHFLWQPALVGRLAVAVIFAPPLMAVNLLDRPDWPVLAQARAGYGDVVAARRPPVYQRWQGTPPPARADAILLPRPRDQLRALTDPHRGDPKPMIDVLRHMPPARDLICGAHPGGIGETCVIAILVAGLYLVYRNYVRGHLPGLFLLAAAATVAVAPIRGPDGQAWQWAPLLGQPLRAVLEPLAESGGALGAVAGQLTPHLSAQPVDVGFTYVVYHLACGEMMLAAWFLATEMTSRPVTGPGQAVFGILCGVGAMLGRLYTGSPIPAYVAVLAANTLTPALDAMRPRVLGHPRWWRRRRRA